MIKRLLVIALLLLSAPALAADELGKVGTDTAHPQTPAIEAEHKEGGAVHHQEGLLDFHPDRVIWTIIIFIVMLIILYPTAWKNVLAGLKSREEKIRKDIADAEAASAKAAATLKDYTAKLAAAEASAREIVTKASADAESAAAQIRARSQAEAEEMKEKALKDIDAAKDAAIREVYDQTATLATNVAEKILRRNLNANDQRDLVAQSLEQLQTVGKN